MSDLTRDRLGQWGKTSDSEIAGSVTGFNRMKNGRYNKVSFIFFWIFLYFPATGYSFSNSLKFFQY